MTPANYTTRIIEKLRQGCDLSEIDEIIAEVVAAEREACAKIAESNIETAKEVLKAADPMLRVQGFGLAVRWLPCEC